MLKAGLLAAVVSVAALAPAQAAEIEVKMLTRGESGMMVFEPALVQIEPGDTVRFVPVDPGHNAESIKGMIPEGAEPFKGGIGKEIVVTFEQEGLYGYQCMPHYGMGMVGLVVVGNKEANLEAAQALKQRGKAAKRFGDLFAELNG
jgi:pseudoazurin